MQIVWHLTEKARGKSDKSLPLSKGRAKDWSGAFPRKSVPTLLNSVLQQRKPEKVANDCGTKAFHVVCEFHSISKMLKTRRTKTWSRLFFPLQY